MEVTGFEPFLQYLCDLKIKHCFNADIKYLFIDPYSAKEAF